MVVREQILSIAITLTVVVALFSAAGCATGISREEAATAYYDLGNAYFDLQKYDEAVRAYSRAIDLDPEILQAGYNLARVYIETGRIDEGVSVLEDLLVADPENTNVVATLAWARYRQEDYQGALLGYRQVLAEIGNDKDALYNAAVISWKLGNLSDATLYFEKYYAESPDITTLDFLGQIYVALGDTENALKYLEQYAAETQPPVETLLIMAELYEGSEAYAKAASLYEDALDRNSALADSRFSYARILLEKIEDYTTGMEQLQIAIDSGYDNAGELSELLKQARSYYREDLEALLNDKGLLEDPVGSEEVD